MRRPAVLILLLALAPLGLLSAPPVAGQAGAGFRNPGEPVQVYFNLILRPALEAKPPGDDAFSSFYVSGLSDRTRAQLGEDQFTRYWRQMAEALARTGFIVSVSAAFGAPLESDGGEQALIHVTGSAHSLPIGDLAFLTVPINTILGCVPGLDANRVSSSACPPDAWPRPRAVGGRFDAVYRVVREGDGWKLILPEALVEQMRRLTPQVRVRRYGPNASVTQGGVTVRITEVVLRDEAAVLSLVIENTNDVAAEVLNALSLASLAGEDGSPSRTRLLRSRIPERVAAHSAAPATLVFDPLPIETRRLVLLLPDLGVGDRVFPLVIEMTVLPLPHAASGDAAVPAEPVLLYLLTASRSDFRSVPAQAAFYHRYLSEAIRRRVSERDFLDYYRSEGIDAWWCRLGLPDAFSLGRPAYDSGKTGAAIEMSVAGRPRSASPGGRESMVTFRVVKEGPAWKLTFPEDVVAVMQARPQERSYQVAASDSADGLELFITHIVIDQTSTTLLLEASNRSDVEIPLDLRATTRLHNQWDVVAAFHRGTLPARLGARSRVSGSLIFGPLPVESRELWLTVGRFLVRGSAVSLHLHIELKRCP